MPDMASISALVTSIKTAIDIAKVVKDSGGSLEKAEVKLQMAELVGTLADAKMELAEVQELLAAKDARIAELDAAFESKDELRRVNDGMYVVDPFGAPKGAAACIRCWEDDHRRRSLIGVANNGWARVCPTCKTQYQESRTGTFEE